MEDEPLKSWNDGSTKRAILDYIDRVTDAGSKDFVPTAERIAVFDNDGTLWCEKPLPIQTGFLLGKIGEQAQRDPLLRDRQPWKAVFEKDLRWLSDVITKHYDGDDTDLRVMATGLLAAYDGESVDGYAEQAEAFLRGSRNESLDRPYLETAYLPMQDLLRHLQASGFTSYIVSGGGRDFMRPITQELYGIPPERVVGTTVALDYREVDGVGRIYHTPKLEVFDDGPNKVVRIWSRIGARPILAAGNSNGDEQMLQFAAQGERASLCLLVNHDDDERDIAYTAGAEKVLDIAHRRHWVAVSVRDDWKQVFATGPARRR